MKESSNVILYVTSMESMRSIIIQCQEKRRRRDSQTQLVYFQDFVTLLSLTSPNPRPLALRFGIVDHVCLQSTWTYARGRKKHILELRSQEMNRERKIVQCRDKSIISDSGEFSVNNHKRQRNRQTTTNHNSQLVS